MSRAKHRGTAVEELATELDRIADCYHRLAHDSDLARVVIFDPDCDLDSASERDLAAAVARLLDGPVDRPLARSLARALGDALDPCSIRVRGVVTRRDHLRVFVTHERVLDRGLYGDVCASDLARHLAARLDGHASAARHGTSPVSGGSAGAATKAEAWVLALLAGLLPAGKRVRFLNEELGNLGTCDHRWQQVDHLVCLAIGMPRLAWMMRRENRRGRA